MLLLLERDVHADTRALLHEGQLLREWLPRYVEARRDMSQQSLSALQPPGLLELVMAYTGPITTEDA